MILVLNSEVTPPEPRAGFEIVLRDDCPRDSIFFSCASEFDAKAFGRYIELTGGNATPSEEVSDFLQAALNQLSFDALRGRFLRFDFAEVRPGGVESGE